MLKKASRGKKQYRCQSCGYLAQSEKRLASHIEKHNKVKVVTMHSCGFCDYKSEKPMNVRRHEGKCQVKLRQEPPANGHVTNKSINHVLILYVFPLISIHSCLSF